jgi:hypothetical protein
MSYGDYVEQLTYLLFLKMADERTKPPYGEPSAVPAKYSWPSLVKKDGDEVFDHYRHLLEKDETLEESDNLPDPDVLAQEIVEDLEAALEQFREIASDLSGESVKLKEN